MRVKDTPAATMREMQDILRLAAEPCRPCDNSKSLISRAAGVLHLSYRRAATLWYGEEGRRVREDEAARLRAERDRLLRLKLARLEREIAELRRQIDAEKGADLARGQVRAMGKTPLSCAS